MKNKSILKNYLSAMVSLIDEMNESDLKKLETGDFKLSLRLVKANTKNIDSKEKIVFDNDKLEQIIEELKLANTREDGLKIVEASLKNKSELELFAKLIDVAVISSDKIAKIKDSIVDSTVGARLRSGAIQGKKI